MDDLDCKLLKELSRDSRITYAELGRKYNLSRVCIRDRINNLVEEGIIEGFTIQVNAEKLGRRLSVYFEIEVRPNDLYNVARELAQEKIVTNIFMLTGSTNLHMHAYLKNEEELESFLRKKLYSREEILRVESNIILKRFKNLQGGCCP